MNNPNCMCVTKLRVLEDAPVRLRAEQVSIVAFRNYEELTNKPQINGVTLIGNRTMTELLAGGLILDGGDAAYVTGGGA